MPYKRAYLWVMLVALMTIPGFWRAYFGVIDQAPFAFHYHAATATFWIFLLAFQAWSAHRKSQLPAHRVMGKSSLLLFPFFLAGNALIMHFSGSKTGTIPDDRFYETVSHAFGLYDLVASTAFAYFFYSALKFRRDVHVHARFMIGTVVILLGPTLGRIIVAPLFIFYEDTLGFATKFIMAITFTQFLIAGLAFFLMTSAPIRGKRPMKVIAVLALVQLAAFYLGFVLPGVRETFMAYGRLSVGLVFAIGFIVGIAVEWRGWIAGQNNLRHTGHRIGLSRREETYSEVL